MCTFCIYAGADLSCGRNKIGVFLNFSGHAHVNVFIADGYDHTANDYRINFYIQMNRFVGFYKFLQREREREERETEYDNRPNDRYLKYNCIVNLHVKLLPTVCVELHPIHVRWSLRK